MNDAAVLCFTAADQRWFAETSGDFNPIHVDAAVARRIVAGQPIVHGVHLLLRALDAHFGRCAWSPAPSTIEATFLHPAVLDEPIRVEDKGDGTIEAVAQGDITLLVARVHAGTTKGLAVADDWRSIDLSPIAPLRKAFPHVTRALGGDAVAALTAVSKLVGMECPGQDSLLSALQLSIAGSSDERALDWRVTRHDRRFGLVRLALSGGHVKGTVDAFVRSRPAPLPTFADAASRVVDHEFAGQRALIVGGSRGLGAATAMLVAAGGGRPIVTYAAGAETAAALQRDAAARAAAIETLRVDVTEQHAATLLADAAARFGVTHLYYFPTPRIFGRRGETFDATLFESFSSVYVAAFVRICAAVHSAVSSLSVFYPSSTAVDDTPAALAEYVAAKVMGESACRMLEQQNDGMRIVVRRLPRVATDQTASIVPTAALDPLDVMLLIVREMQS